ncbi:MAG: GTPase HflX [Leptospirales bacterium]|nr:GTPase HflX [Leptospirales bacterium]
MDASVNRISYSKDDRALLISIFLKGEDRERCEYSLEELILLVDTAGGIVVDTMTIKRDGIDPAYIFGLGYIEIIRKIIEEENIKLVVFDLNNIKPAQIRNLEDKLKCRVIGRNEVILDIFIQRAKSAEAKIQVELAQLKYILPRLKGLGGVLSRLGGGIGTRGPGETMLETDKRHIQKRIVVLKEKLKKFEEHRRRIRNSRSNKILGSVVGYTNAGKSTLINLIAKDDLFVEDRLFATLDSYTRSVYLSPEISILLTDTVGFIQNLPANLIESFRSTLEDIENSDFIIHVVDINAPDIESNIKIVEAELSQLKIENKPIIIFFNKTDKAPENIINLIKNRYPDSISGSAKTSEGIEQLKELVAKIILSLM